MKIAVEQRGDRWLAQVVSVGVDLHWIEHRRITKSVGDLLIIETFNGGY